MRPFMSVREAAKALRLSPGVIKALVQEGILEGFRLPQGKRVYITRASVERFLTGAKEGSRVEARE